MNWGEDVDLILNKVPVPVPTTTTTTTTTITTATATTTTTATTSGKGSCPAGYYLGSGDIPGWGQIRGKIETSLAGCGEECSNTKECCSFEFSVTFGLCNLNRDCQPSKIPYKDYYFCIQNKEGCGPVKVTGDNYDGRFTVENLLTIQNKELVVDNKATYWLSPNARTATFILNLGCRETFDSIRLVNVHNRDYKDRATKQFRLYTSQTKSGPWTQVLDTQLEDSRQQQDPLPIQLIALDTKTTAQFVKFELLSWWGRGGGLMYFNIVDEVQQVQPVTNVQPVQPILPALPVLPVQPVQPFLPVLPVKPVLPVQPVLPVVPVVPVLPVQPVQPVLPVLPAQPAPLLQPVQPVPEVPQPLFLRS
eukprot:GFUD01013736.1.p1 GENE.GFUD01013736.1~~GFUD01013736.1.p1  ORF type:complete len:403 (-),score=79.02 GFUD01013736.1:170-1258(-)